MKRWRAFIVCAFVLIFVATSVPKCFAVDASDARTAIDQAELSLNSAFVAVSKADAEGAYVGSLIITLEDAGYFLSEANLALRSGNYEIAISLAMKCEGSVEGVVTKADRLGVIAERTTNDTLLFAAFWSGLGLILLLVFGLIVWWVLKERYFEKVLKMKPEVEELR
jgi:hypothetical protein